MKLFEIIPEPIADLLPPILNQDVPSPIDQMALQVVNVGKIASFASVGLAIKTREVAMDTFNELVELGENALTHQEAMPADTKEIEETIIAEPEEPQGPTLDEQFQTATQDIKTLTSKPDNATLAELYALFKQATEGDVSGKRPGITKIAERFKFDAWSKKKGVATEEAKQMYINKVEFVLASQ